MDLKIKAEKAISYVVKQGDVFCFRRKYNGILMSFHIFINVIIRTVMLIGFKSGSTIL